MSKKKRRRLIECWNDDDVAKLNSEMQAIHSSYADTRDNPHCLSDDTVALLKMISRRDAKIAALQRALAALRADLAALLQKPQTTPAPATTMERP